LGGSETLETRDKVLLYCVLALVVGALVYALCKISTVG
jgi:hypothetical protein